MATALPLLVVVLGLDTKSVDPLISRSSAIVNGIEGSPTLFKSPNPPLAQVKGHITDLSVAQTAFKSHLGTRAPRDDKQQLLVGDMKGLHAYVQQLVSANPSQAQIIAEAAAMTLRKKKVTHKSDLAVKPIASGSLGVVAKSVKGARGHEWQLSTDGGKTWSDLPATTQCKTAVHGLQLGATVLFRQRVLTRTGLGDWSQAISAIVT